MNLANLEAGATDLRRPIVQILNTDPMGTIVTRGAPVSTNLCTAPGKDTRSS